MSSSADGITNHQHSEDVDGDIQAVTQGNLRMPSNDECFSLANMPGCVPEMAVSGDQQQIQQQYQPLLGKNHRHNRQSSSTSAAVHLPPPQNPQALRAQFEDVFPIENAPILEGRLAQPLDNHRLHLYPATLLDLPNGLSRNCYSVEQTLPGSSPRATHNTPWKACEGVDGAPERSGALRDSTLHGQSIGQSPVAHDSMKDEETGPNQYFSTCASHSLTYNTSPVTANNLPSPAPSHSVDIRKRPPEAVATPPGLRLAKLSPTSSSTIELQGCTPLFQAVLLGNLKIVAILVARGCNANAVNVTGQTVLHIAARSGNVKMVEYLITCGINLNCQDNEGNTALHLAVINGYEEIVEMLVNAGAQMDISNN
ncbi:hypothetical protein EKO27_g2466 [Xylaria grammica]|uniref:Uncharacterized protein n=1 Tax=Xylaria grammica TaxID=363999 RepID=A0A439DE09_9PEZI|nr:hypothetical protein EKO27_g2466 [Xylaria grammica]